MEVIDPIADFMPDIDDHLWLPAHHRLQEGVRVRPHMVGISEAEKQDTSIRSEVRSDAQALNRGLCLLSLL